MNKTKLLVTALISLVVMMLGVILGTQGVSIGDVFNVIWSNLTGAPLYASEVSAAIIWDLRIPRVLLAFMAGGALSLSGAVLQSLLQNPLASPYTMGVSSGASLGAAIAIVMGSTILLPVVGMGFALLAMLGVVVFARRIDVKLSGNTVILSGMVLSLFLNGILTLISALAYNESRRIALWQMGNFALRGYSYVGMLLPFYIIGIVAMFLKSRELDVITLGDEQAFSVGVNVKRTKVSLFIWTALLTGASVSLCGVIGFVDMISPHIARRVFGSKNKLVIPGAVMIGGIMMVVADLVARMVLPGKELPVGAVTAMLGAPFFAYIFIRNRRR